MQVVTNETEDEMTDKKRLVEGEGESLQRTVGRLLTIQLRSTWLCVGIHACQGRQSCLELNPVFWGQILFSEKYVSWTMKNVSNKISQPVLYALVPLYCKRFARPMYMLVSWEAHTTAQ